MSESTDRSLRAALKVLKVRVSQNSGHGSPGGELRRRGDPDQNPWRMEGEHDPDGLLGFEPAALSQAEPNWDQTGTKLV